MVMVGERSYVCWIVAQCKVAMDRKDNFSEKMTPMVCTEEWHPWFLFSTSNYSLNKERCYFALYVLVYPKEYLGECNALYI